MIRHLLAVSLLALATPAAAALSPAEQKMIETVDANAEAQIAFLEKMVNQNSGTLNLEGVKKVADMVRPELEKLGFTVTWTPTPETARAGHLTAVHKGRKGTKNLLLIAHLDTVFEPDHPFQTWSRAGNIATGPGVGDDKGGISVILAALQAMHAAGTLKNANIEIALTGDEEDAGTPRSAARAQLIAAGKRADAALDFENLSRENGQDMGSIARRSSNTWELSTTGRAGHSSGIFTQRTGDGAIFELSRILTAFRTELPEPSLTFNVGLVSGGDTAVLADEGTRGTATGKSNIIPQIAYAIGDFRTLSDEQTQRVRAKMQAIVARNSPGTTAAIKFQEGYPPMAPTEGNRALLARLNAVNADMGLPQMPELDPLKRGAGDIGFVARDVDGLVGLGPSGSGSHAPGETVDLDSISKQAKRAAILMSRLSTEKAK
ncbi:M20/M25/M40 family metallo-hydrolase [Sandaracinobacteroides hominis]|uniref:M20/M25/M40 family metallo-hydrolase n=1 Tax=Sandaracinobacteroides hominis TaxID=2780086 RepID=UPI0018F2CEB5|nr:M20/M25/M40 family metallo-hydrolase [Sandaracinobacteroides hominis]